MSATGGATDEQLMGRVQVGDNEAFGVLFDRHGSRALAVSRAVCGDLGRAEDAVQEGFLTIWQSRSSFRPGRGSFRGWAMTIVRNRAVDSVRAENSGTRPHPVTTERLAPIKAPGSVEDDTIARSEAAALRASLKELPDPQAEVIVLAFYGQLSHSEIAAALALPRGTVKGRMRLGLEKLRASPESAAGSG